ncbi:hypothetical protein K0U83_06705 [bacterium]|nr:hypothetical protein [bacterium]
MGRVDTGDNLAAGLLQPGWKVSYDGYGLMTCTATYKSDRFGSFSFIERGSSFSALGFTNLKAHKAAISFDALEVATATVDYVGIELSVNSGLRTEPQVSGSQGLTSENITTHPNFFELATGFSGTPIAGVGATGTLAVPAYPAVAATNPAEYSGNNGATFELATGRKFLGFKKAEFKDFYGKSNYLAPQTSFSGHFYTTQSATVQGLINRVGKTSGDGSFLTIDLLPAYMGTTFTVSGKNQLLLAQVNSEDYGSLYKVQYEIRYNREGYVASVYAPA